MTSPLFGRCSWTVLAALLSVASFQSATVFAACEVGGRPGSTLLYPYFEVDTDPSGLTTLISVTNDTNSATMTRVVVWTDWAIPVLAFDVYLRARDIQTINLRDVLNGIVPATGAGSDLSGFPGCAVSPPTYANPALSSSAAQQLRAYLTGVSGPLDALCAGEAHGDGLARGYVTIDAVSRCSGLGFAGGGGIPTATPPSPSYFTGVALLKNSLWGDLLYVDPYGNSAQGVEAVAIQGESSFEGRVNTFYGKFHDYDGRDKRSPLPTTFSARYLQGGAFDGGTDLLVFRDTGSTSVAKRPCGTFPSWHPLVAANISAVDEGGGLVYSDVTNFDFPLATQRVAVASIDPSLATSFGRLNLTLSPPGGGPRGAWVIAVMTAEGRFSAAFDAARMNTGCGLNPGS